MDLPFIQGAAPTAEVTICLKNAKAWNDRKKGRIVQTNLVMINTGTAGVCNVTGRYLPLPPYHTQQASKQATAAGAAPI